LARGAGVRVVMITGDAPLTARSIAEQAGLPAGPVLSQGSLEVKQNSVPEMVLASPAVPEAP
jgi:magnesium-transporting ATPase (P-type)